LKEVKPQEQYVVFLIRPSGIGLFKDLVQTARDDGYEVGFDALEENREIHFTAPPPIDDEAVSEKRPSVINGEPSTSGASGGSSRGRSSAGGGTGADGSGGISASHGNASEGTGYGSRQGNATGTGSSTATPSGQASSTGNQNGSAEASRPAETNARTTAPSATNGATTAVSGTNGTPSTPPPPPPPPKPKSWWQRFLEWIGLG
jgi:hypothetical protein